MMSSAARRASLYCRRMLIPTRQAAMMRSSLESTAGECQPECLR